MENKIDSNKNDNKELLLYLKNVFKSSMNINLFKSSVLLGYEIKGNYKKYNITINCDKNSGELVFRTNMSINMFLERIAPYITTFMDGNGPICKYELAYAGDKSFETVIEWGSDVEKRLVELKRNATNSFPLVVRNAVALVETKKMKDERLGFSSLSPIFFPNSSVDDLAKLTKKVQDYNEQDAFLALQVLSSVPRQVLDGTWNGAFVDFIGIKSASDIIKNRIYQLVGEGYSNSDDFLESINYKKWLYDWNNYFTYDKKCEYMEARMNGEDVSDFSLDSVKKKMRV